MFEDEGAGWQDNRAPTNLNQAGTKQGDFHRYEDDKDTSITAKLRKAGEEVINERNLQHKEEATGVVRGVKDQYSRTRRGRGRWRKWS